MGRRCVSSGFMMKLKTEEKEKEKIRMKEGAFKSKGGRADYHSRESHATFGTGGYLKSS